MADPPQWETVAVSRSGENIGPELLIPVCLVTIQILRTTKRAAELVV
jgi:hypothetical protein